METVLRRSLTPYLYVYQWWDDKTQYMNGKTISHSSISKLAQHHWRQIRYNFQFHWRPTLGLSRGNFWKVKPPFSFRFLQRTSAHITPQSYSFFGFSLFSIFQQETSKIWRNGNGIKVERSRRNPKRYERNDEENDENRETTNNRAGALVEHRSKCANVTRQVFQ